MRLNLRQQNEVGGEVKRSQLSNPDFQFPPVLSKNTDLQKQHTDINNSQDGLLTRFRIPDDTSGSDQEKLIMEEIGSTPDASKEEILFGDIMDFLFQGCTAPIFATTTSKAMKLACHFANETYGHSPPYCVTPDYITWSYMRTSPTSSFSETVNYLQNAGLRRETFFRTKYIFIHIPDDNRMHSTLLVISPVYKTIEFLDSDYGKMQELRDDTLHHAITFLWKYLGRDFIAPQWRLRYDSSSQQPPHTNHCGVAVMTNTMAIALGYSLPQWICKAKDPYPIEKFIEDDSDKEGGPKTKIKATVQSWRAPEVEKKRRQTASELLHGRLESYHGEDNAETHPYVYQLGNVDYTSPQVQVHLENGVEVRVLKKFQRLDETPHIYDKLPKELRRKGERLYSKIGKPTKGDMRIQKRQQRKQLINLTRNLEEYYSEYAPHVVRKIQAQGLPFGLLGSDFLYTKRRR